jgi:hypothetical protein
MRHFFGLIWLFWGAQRAQHAPKNVRNKNPQSRV